MGFEPTVGFPTLDFESSALNRTQPPFRDSDDNVERPTSNIQRSMQTVSLGWQHFDVEEWQLSNGRGNSLLATLFKQNLHSGTS